MGNNKQDALLRKFFAEERPGQHVQNTRGTTKKHIKWQDTVTKLLQCVELPAITTMLTNRNLRWPGPVVISPRANFVSQLFLEAMSENLKHHLCMPWYSLLSS